MHPEFPLREGLIHLNHAAVAPWPKRTADAVRRFTEENLTSGSRNYPDWLRVEQGLREQLQRLLNAASADDIALLKNTSEALSVVAHGLDWRSGDNIVTSDQEFPSNRIVWQSLERYGVETRLADISGPAPEQALMDACDGGTRLLSISSVQYASGLRMDLEALGAFCRRRGILFCVDAIQSLGVIPFDVQAVQADFVMADGHKWLLGPEGLAVFYCRPELRERLRLHQYGWHMVEAAGDFDRQDWRPAGSARRFECGSPNMLAIHALSASLSLLEETGIETIAETVSEKTGYLIELLEKNLKVKVISPILAERRAGIVTFVHDGMTADRLYARLMEQGVLCAARGGGVRFSPHFHTPEDHLRQAVEWVHAAD
jgi:selenocysteine lyase/cysteine desulfurase